MTAAGPLGFLARLDEARAAATPGEWEALAPAAHGVNIDAPLFGPSSIIHTRTATATTLADAALIVAAVNSLPKLTAALRSAWNVADELDRFGADRDRNNEGEDEGMAASAAAYLRCASEIHRAITAALDGTP